MKDNINAREPIAVIGYSYRAPGTGRKNLWEYLEEGKCAWSQVPAERFDHDAFYNADKDKAGCIASKGGHFLPDDAYAFEPAFFNLRADEARQMDPQQRMALECAFEAAEHAGITINDLAGSDTGIFAANGNVDTALELIADLPTTSKYTATGTACCMFANRLSYFLDVRGPSVVIDAACASSSSALHLAVQNLRFGECESAFVVASSLAMTPAMWVTLDTMGALSPEGRSYSYDTKASGFGRGDGAACLLLKPLRKAILDNDPIQAIVANTACNHGGRTDGITVPSSNAQIGLMRRVHEEIGWNPAETTVVEGHGTGTLVGDPIEARSVATVFGADRSPGNPIFLGSIKSNIGHAENASGLLAVIKGIMMLQHGIILPTADFDSPNAVVADTGMLKVLKSPQPWPQDAPKRVCVSNFGFGGANASALLEAYENESRSYLLDTNGSIENLAKGTTHSSISKNGLGLTAQRQLLFTFSARTENSLRAYLASFAEYLENQAKHSLESLQDICYTLGQRRTHFQHRTAISAHSFSTLRDEVMRLETSDDKLTKSKKVTTAFIFTGQGAQWAQMAIKLEQHPIFTSALQRAEKVLRSFGSTWLLREELSRSAEDSHVNKASVSQPACTAVQLALVELLRSWTVLPSIVTGHSSGEIAAAYAAEFISFETALALAFFRGKAATRASQNDNLRGAMMAIGASVEEATALLSSCSDSGYATIAAINSPSSITLSGDATAIDEIHRTATSRGLFARKLKVDVAYHSRHMESVAESYLEDIKPYYAERSNQPIAKRDVVFVSSVSGQVETGDAIDPSYWVRNLLQPVRLVSAIETMFSEAVTSRVYVPNIVIEVGPHPALKGPFEQTLDALGNSQASANVTYMPTLTRGTESNDAIMAFAALAFTHGISLDLASVNQTDASECRVVTDLPRYEWDKSERYAHVSRTTKHSRRLGNAYHALLGWASPHNEGKSRSFRQVFTLDEMPWLRGHRIAGEVLFPMTGYLALAFEAVRSVSPNAAVGAFVVREFHAKRGLQIAEEEMIDLTTKVTPFAVGPNTLSNTWWTFEVMTWTDKQGWIVHAQGQVSIESSTEINNPDSAASAKLLHRDDLQAIDTDSAYKTMRGVGLDYGPGFALITQVAWSDDTAVFEIQMKDLDMSIPSDSDFNLATSIATSDNLLHGTGLLKTLNGDMQGLIPVYCRQLRIFDKVPVTESSKITVVTRLISEDKKLGSLTSCTTAFAHVNGSLTPVAELLHLTSRHNSGVKRNPFLGDGKAESYRWDLAPLQPAFQQVANAGPSISVTVSGVLKDAADDEFAQKLSDRLRELPGYSARIVPYQDLVADESSYFMFIDNGSESITKTFDEKSFETMRRLLLGSAGIIWVIPEHSRPEAHTMIGFLRSLRLEDASRPLLLVKDVSLDDAGVAAVANVAGRLSGIDGTKHSEQEFVLSNGEVLVPRLVPTSNAAELLGFEEKEIEKRIQALGESGEMSIRDTVQMTVDSVGSLDSIYFRRIDLLAQELGDDEIIVKVEAVGVNFRDLLLVLGSLPWHEPGLEGAGTVAMVGRNVTSFKPGDRVFYSSMQGGFANYVRMSHLYAGKLSDLWTFAQGATLSVAYSTAIWCLEDVARLQAGESVLIHAATGAAGQACIAIAKLLGANIFATAGTPAKRLFLHETLGIPEENIFSSRTPEFHDQILLATGGKGVDVVVNSLSGALLERTLDIVAEFGRFVEIGKKDILDNNYMGLRTFERCISFTSVDLRQRLLKRPQEAQRFLASITERLESGGILPIAGTEVPLSDVASGLRKLQTGDNIGKVVVKVSPTDTVLAEPPRAGGKLLIDKATYVITGGTGGIGRSLALWMLEHGAKHIVLLGRSGSSRPEIAELTQKHPSVRAVACDVASRASLEEALESLDGLPPVRGVIHGALYLRDALLTNTTFDDWQKVSAPKIDAAWHLHELFPQLDFFISLASITGVTGNAGQSIYGGTTTFLEAFSAYRREQGLPAISIQLPMIEDAGYALDNGMTRSMRENTGVWLQMPQIEHLIEEAIVACKTGQYDEAVRATAFVRDQQSPDMSAIGERLHMYSALRQQDNAASAMKGSSKYSDAESFLPALMERVATLAVMDADEVDPDIDLVEYSLDSLVTVELRNWIRRETGHEVALNQVLTMPNLRALAEFVFSPGNAS
ncbi:hypothetical protein CKM354_001012200 [Cercospora kikuchii]|uniref:Polyketide synthase n=1 Tax=Cercospora kikuchii TaxID=84275 RepID=A0A9P3CQS7_9PEZI|nr:uncharacterized protein CKM354_001012200 [Cercospora kikuchii]GIZ47021.1 hypothetical protein CKM354_001012200 [Cercospora kikuchii]